MARFERKEKTLKHTPYNKGTLESHSGKINELYSKHTNRKVYVVTSFNKKLMNRFVSCILRDLLVVNSY